jgi:proline dehydrogenase
LLCYSVEAEKAAKGAGEGLIEANLEETKRAIRAAGSYQRSRDGELAPTWIAVKRALPTLQLIPQQKFRYAVSGMVADPQIFERASTALQSSSAWQRGQRLPPEPLFPSSPALTSTDESVLSALHVELDICAALASTLNVRLDVDAEQSWLQDAVDRYYQVLADRHNAGRTQAIVGQTYQTYRIDTRDRLLADLAHARAACLPSLTKLVRGAYHEAENARAARLRRPSPVWPSKAATDECYDACAEIMADEVIRDVRSADTRHPQVGVLFASHNAESTQKTLARFREAGLVRNAGRQLEVSDALRGRIVFGQLLGMPAGSVLATDRANGAHRHVGQPDGDPRQPLCPFVYLFGTACAQVVRRSHLRAAHELTRRAQHPVRRGSSGPALSGPPRPREQGRPLRSVLPQSLHLAVLTSDRTGDGTGGRGVREERRAVSRELRRRVRAMVPWD